MKIQSEQEYNEALVRIDQRMNAPLNTPESAELEQLVTAVEAYEAIHYPIDSPAETQPLKKLIEASEHIAKNGLLSLDDAFDEALVHG